MLDTGYTGAFLAGILFYGPCPAAGRFVAA